MQKTDPELSLEKDVIKNETVFKANTALRIGTMLENLIDSKVNLTRAFLRDGSQAMAGDIDLNNFKLKQLAPATANGEAVNFEQFNAALDGLKPKDDVRAASVSSDLVHFDEQTVDGVALLDGDRFLDKDNADDTIRGIWIIKAGAAWERSPDADSGIELQGAFVQVSEGTSNANTAWIQYAIDVNLGVTGLLWRQVTSTTPDATTVTKGKIKLAGDLAGTADAPTVPGLAAKENTANKGVANGYASLDSTGKVPAAQIPDTHFKGKYLNLAALQAAHPTANDGDYAVVDAGAGSDAKEYIWDANEGWIQSSGTSVASAVTFTPTGNVSAGNVQNAIAEVDAEKVAKAGDSMTGDLAMGGNKIKGLAAGTGNGDAVRYEQVFGVFAPLNSPALTGNPTAPNQSSGDNSGKIANTAFVQQEIVANSTVANAGAKLYLFNYY